MHTKIITNIAIFGGGIAGLWLLNRLKEDGHAALLFEAHALGGGQTVKSQGIIHGGVKYALTGRLSPDTSAVAAMPARWRACLLGQGEVDLSSVPILSDKQYLWSPSVFQAALARLLASSALAGQVESLSKAQYPAFFQHPDFKGRVFALNEMVIDVPALVRALASGKEDCILQGGPSRDEDFILDANGCLSSVTFSTEHGLVEVHAKEFIFAAGAGNEMLFRKMKQPAFAMQKRPVHMVWVEFPDAAPLYAHCVGLGARPRLTITTHYRADGSTVWYLGGLLAEEGIDRSPVSQQAAALKELRTLFPWLDFSKAIFASRMIDRAEPLQKDGLKPASSYVERINNVTVAWPTKLVLAPQLVDEVMAILAEQRHSEEPAERRSNPEQAWVQNDNETVFPPFAKPLWEEVS